MTSPQIQTKRHPIRGALYGIPLGLSAAYFLYFRFSVFPFDSLTAVITRFVIIIVAGMVLGVLWAYVAPAKKPKGPAPAMVDDEPPAAAIDDEPPAAEIDDEPPAAEIDDEPPADDDD